MSLYGKPFDGWTAGRHWREAMTLGGFITPSSDPERATAHTNQALFHLAAARLLLDHDPVDVLEAYPVEAGVEPPRRGDWRDN